MYSVGYSGWPGYIFLHMVESELNFGQLVGCAGVHKGEAVKLPMRIDISLCFEVWIGPLTSCSPFTCAHHAYPELPTPLLQTPNTASSGLV